MHLLRPRTPIVVEAPRNGHRRTPARLLGALGVCVLALSVLAGCEEVSARRRIQEGNKLYNEGKYEEAIAHYEGALQKKPELLIGWYNLGLTHLALFAPGAKTPENEKHAQGAITAFSKYLEKHPDDTKARDYLLSTYIDSGQYQGALAYFDKKFKEDPKDMQALAQLANINAQAGQYDEASRWHRKRAELEESTDAKADALYSIGVLSWRRLNGHAEIMGDDRAKIADEGLNALMEADKVRPNHQSTLTYANLLYRERALAHETSYARAVDFATAQIFFKKATEIAKAQQAASAQPPPGTPDKPAGGGGASSPKK